MARCHRNAGATSQEGARRGVELRELGMFYREVCIPAWGAIQPGDSKGAIHKLRPNFRPFLAAPSRALKRL